MKYLNELETFIRQSPKPMKPTTITFTLFVFYLICAVLIGYFSYQSSQKKNDPIQSVKVSPIVLSSNKSLAQIIEEMPNGSLKSNLMIVLGTDMGGDSDQLNEILRAYAEMKIKEIEKKGQL